MWGLSDDDILNTNTPASAATAAPVQNDEGEVIESVLDHRRKETGSGKWRYMIFFSISKITLFFTHY